MYLQTIILAVIALMISIYMATKSYKEKGIEFIKMLFGVEVALIFLSYPLYEEYIGISRIGCSILHSLQALTLGENFERVSSINPEIFINRIYIIFNYTLYVVAPLLMATTLLSLFSNIFSKLKLRISFKKEYHIFSEINEKTIYLAKKIAMNKNAKIIFANKDSGKVINNKKIIKFKETIGEIDWYKIKKEKYFYFMSSNEDNNLNEGLEFIERVKNDEQARVYILNDKPEAYVIVDSFMSSNTQKTRLEVQIVNEAERIVLERLRSLPIKRIFNNPNKEVVVLIVGCGKFGQAFLKNITWCFQVIGYSLKIIVIEKNAEDVINKINMESPQLLKEYNINFISDNIESVISRNLLKDQDINYVVVSAGEDSNNFNIAIALRRYFLVNNKDNILIDVAIENAYKNKNIKILKNEDKQGYDINTFGSIEETYFKNSIIDLNIEERARLVHSITWSNDVDFVEFNKSEYNKKSSRAVVVHIPYKLYSILLDDYTGDIVKDLEAYKEKIKDANVVKQLAENEHDRWMAYMYADGYKVATMEDIRKYYVKMGNNHKHTLAKLHPALVRNDELAKVEKDLADLTEELTGERNQKDFTKVDYKLVQNLDKIELMKP